MDGLSRSVGELLSARAGTQVDVVATEPVDDHWSAAFGGTPWVVRCQLAGGSGAVPASVVAKARRPAGTLRSAPEQLRNERAALELLTRLDSRIAPRFLAGDDRAGIVVMEDLGRAVSLEDLLVGSDPKAAERGLEAFARAVARLHLTTAGHANDFYDLRARLGPVDPSFDRVSILGLSIATMWDRLEDVVSERSHLPPPGTARPDVDNLIAVLAEPGRHLMLSNGDQCPSNCRIDGDTARLMDFEHAAVRHAALDVSAFRFPFPACGCWSRFPVAVRRRTEEAYRAELAGGGYPRGTPPRALAAACAAWAIVRTVRLPRLEEREALHPLRFSRRGQLLSTLDTAVSTLVEAAAFPELAAWLADVLDALGAVWPDAHPDQDVYPAFRG